MILWPHILPQYLQVSGYQEQAGDMMLRSSMEAGPQKVRRRFTAAPRPLSGEILVTREQFEFFKYWYEYVLLGGSLRFGWADPWSTTVLTNLVTNGGFDSATTGWTGGDSSLASSAPSLALFGNCLEITRTGGTYQTAYQQISLSAGKDYQLTGYLKSGTSGDETGDFVVVDDFDSAELGREQIATSSIWQAASLPFTAITTGTHTFYCEKVGSTAGTMLFDEVSLVDITTGIAEMRFTEPPSWNSPDGVNIKISMKLEILP